VFKKEAEFYLKQREVTRGNERELVFKRPKLSKNLTQRR